MFVKVGISKIKSGKTHYSIILHKQKLLAISVLWKREQNAIRNARGWHPHIFKCHKDDIVTSSGVNCTSIVKT